jgi:hypothetical protein
MSKSNVIKFPESVRTKRHRVDTICLDKDTLRRLKNPPFQRPFKMTPAIASLVGEIKQTGVFPGILTLGVLHGEVFTIDGQHRLEAVKLSERTDVLADVHYLDCESDQEMAEEFHRLNSSLVRFGPDDLLRAREVGSPSLQRLRKLCPFVGYDSIRRSDRAPLLGMSLTLRAWYGSEPEAPVSSAGSAATLADRLSLEDAHALGTFLNMCLVAWGREHQYARLWGGLNLTLCAWLYRRMVLAPVVKVQRRTRLESDQFGKCLMALSADSLYLDYLVGRRLSDDHRAPTYNRIKSAFVRRLRDDGVKAPVFPQPPWVHA